MPLSISLDPGAACSGGDAPFSGKSFPSAIMVPINSMRTKKTIAMPAAIIVSPSNSSGPIDSINSLAFSDAWSHQRRDPVNRDGSESWKSPAYTNLACSTGRYVSGVSCLRLNFNQCEHASLQREPTLANLFCQAIGCCYRYGSGHLTAPGERGICLAITLQQPYRRLVCPHLHPTGLSSTACGGWDVNLRLGPGNRAYKGGGTQLTLKGISQKGIHNGSHLSVQRWFNPQGHRRWHGGCG